MTTPPAGDADPGSARALRKSLTEAFARHGSGIELGMPSSYPLSVFQRLPKTDLHVHLDGSMRLPTVLELARDQGIELPAHDLTGLRASMHIG